MSGSDVLEARLTELEIKLAFADDTVQSLITADLEQSRRIAALEALAQALRGELAALRSGSPGDAQAEPPPPHY